MQNFCTKCGHKLIAGNSFCTKCGARVASLDQTLPGPQPAQPVQQRPQAPGPQPVQQGQQMPQAQPVQPRQQAPGPQQMQQPTRQVANTAMNAASKIIGMNAKTSPGDMPAGVVTRAAGAAGPIGTAIGVARTAAGYANSARNAAQQAREHQTTKAGSAKLLPALIVSMALVLLWVFQIVLMRMNVNPIPVKLLNYLTFARGGVSRNPLVFIGGNIGKGVVAAGLSGLAAGGAGAIAAGARQLFSPANFAKQGIGGYIAGIGIGLLGYQIFTGYGSLTGIMVAVSGALVALRRTPSSGKYGSIFSGATMGFAMAVPLAVIPFTFTHLIIGLPVAAAGGIIILVNQGNATNGTNTGQPRSY